MTITWSCWLPVTETSAAPVVAPLRTAGIGASFSYSLRTLKSCEVGDGLTLVKVAGASGIRVTNVQVLYGGDANAREASVTYQVISFRRGTTEGQLQNNFSLGALANGLSHGSALGSELEPLKTSQLWYDVMAQVKVTANHDEPWFIKGLRVTYRSGTTAYATIFHQSIKLPATEFCARN
jgi:hypothetical protein